MSREATFPAQGNLSPSSEIPFLQLMQNASDIVFDRIIDHRSAPELKFITDKDTGRLDDVHIHIAEATGNSQELKGPIRSPAFVFRNYEIHKAIISAKDGTAQHETAWRQAPSESDATKLVWSNTREGDPQSLMRGFMYAAASAEEFDSALGLIHTDKFHTALVESNPADDENSDAAADKLFRLDANMALPLVKRAFSHPRDMPVLQEMLLGHMNQAGHVYDFSAVIRRMELAIASKIQEFVKCGIADQLEEIIKGAADFLTPFDELGMLRSSMKNPNQGILGYIDVVTLRPFSEILLRNLTRRSPAETQKQAEQNGFFARSFISKKLEQYSRDPQRHTANVAIIREQLFPDQSRTGSLSRANLVNLSNAIATSLNRTLPYDKKLPIINVAQPGGVAEAVHTVLGITTANDASPEIAKQHEIDNGLVSDIIALLLESNAKPRYNIDERDASIASLTTYTHARGRQARDRSVFGLQRPGHGTVS